MKKLVFFSLLVIVFQQASAQTPGIEKLTVNSSPAFILLGVQPDNIQRPSTPRDFIGSVQSAIVNQQLQPNFSLETNPFNWKKNTFDNQFYRNDYFYSGWEALKKNFAFSIATSTSDTVVFGDLREGMGLGYGMRITLVPGKVNKIVRDNFIEWEILEVEGSFLQLLQSDMLLGDTSFTDAKIDAHLQTTLAAINAGIVGGVHLLPDNEIGLIQRLQAIAQSYKGVAGAAQKAKVTADRGSLAARKLAAINNINNVKAPFAREGFMLEFAASGVTVFQENKWENSHFGKAAIWLTPSWRMPITKEKDPNDATESLDIMAVLRHIWNDKNVDPANYLDLGGKLQFNRTKWSTSFEITARHASEVPETVSSNWTNCWLFSFSYTLLQTATFKFSFGSQFDGNSRTYTQPRDMFIAGGINLGLTGN